MFEVMIERQADKALRALDPSVRIRIAEDVYSLGVKFMNGKRLGGILKGCRSFRSGDYRIIYDVNIRRQIVRILRIDHRREVYKTS